MQKCAEDEDVRQYLAGRQWATVLCVREAGVGADATWYAMAC